MDRAGYQRMLFRTAMLVMGCDGELHSSEIREIELAFEKSSLFKDLDFQEELDRVMAEFDENRKHVVTRYFEEIEVADLDPVQKLQILEIILRIMYADDRVDPNEVRFLRLVKSRLGVMDGIFAKRFGDLDILPTGHIPEKSEDTVGEFINEVEFPDFNELDTSASKDTGLKGSIGKLLRRGR